jgi:hypothetical protein
LVFGDVHGFFNFFFKDNFWWLDLSRMRTSCTRKRHFRLAGIANESWRRRRCFIFFIITAALSFLRRYWVETRRRHAEFELLWSSYVARDGRLLKEMNSILRQRLCFKVVLSGVVRTAWGSTKLSNEFLLLVFAHL